MARTAVSIEHSLVHAFEHNEAAYLVLVATISGGEIQLAHTIAATSASPNDSARAIHQQATDMSQPCMFLAKALRDPGVWTLLTYADDELHSSKARMVLASVKDSVREQLGASNFSQDVHASCLADLQPAELLSKHDASALLSSDEQVAADVQRQEASTTAAGPTGGSKVPFQSTPALLSALAGFSAGAVVVTMNAAEQFDLGSTLAEASAAAVSAALPAAAPAFFLAKPSDSDFAVFAFWCPDSAEARPRMMHSAAKGALLATLTAAGVQVSKSCDVRDADDVQDALTQQQDVAAAAAGDDSGALQELQFDRPSAPSGGGSRRRKGARGKPKMASVEL